MPAAGRVADLTLGALYPAAQPETAQAQVVLELRVDRPPPRIERYPRTWYDQREVYLVDGRWYYRRGPHWYYYGREPAPLRRHRVEVYERPRHRHREVWREPPPRAHRHRHRDRDRDYHRHSHRGRVRDDDGRRAVIVVR
jgi:hypothetical protein